jgi:hypothetical protein
MGKLVIRIVIEKMGNERYPSFFNKAGLRFGTLRKDTSSREGCK